MITLGRVGVLKIRIVLIHAIGNTAGKIAVMNCRKAQRKRFAKVRRLRSERVKTRIQQAKILADSLSQLKGAAMKVGQLMSLDSSDLLPKEVTEVLAQLQIKPNPRLFLHRKRSTPGIDEKLYGVLPSSRWRLPPPASVSAYRSLGRGKLALKVQYPGVREHPSDLAIYGGSAASHRLRQANGSRSSVQGVRIGFDSGDGLRARKKSYGVASAPLARAGLGDFISFPNRCRS